MLPVKDSTRNPGASRVAVTGNLVGDDLLKLLIGPWERDGL